MSNIEKSEQQIAKFDQFDNVGEMLEFAEYLINSKLVPSSLNTPEKVVTVISQGRELGLGPVTSVNNIHDVEGKATLSVHVIAALLERTGVAWKIVEDFATVEDKDGNVVDYRTTIRFYKKWHDETITNDVSYTWKEAQKQGLTTKHNWQKMPKIMMRNRCLALGARFVNPNSILGSYTVDEVADFKDKEYQVDPDTGEVQLGEYTIDETQTEE